MNVDRLRFLFSRALRTSLATPLLLAGCQGAPTPPNPDPIDVGEDPIDVSQHSDVECVNSAPAINDLSIEPPPDSIQLRAIYLKTPPLGLPALRVRTSVGQACATATDPQDCQARLDTLEIQQGFPRTSGLYVDGAEDFVAMTRGDEVAAFTNAEAVRALLGRIDTPQEAALLAFAAGYSLCEWTGDRHGKVRAFPDGTFSVIGTQGYACGEGTALTQHVVGITASGELTEQQRTVLEEGSPTCTIGRRPAGLQHARTGDCEDARGRYFADSARLEAASIHAFLRLRDELALHGASTRLQDAALTSAADEVRHTEATVRLALRFGATPVPPAVTDLPLRPLDEVLLDNTVEGCVRETYGALVAHHQALHARDPEIREAMVRIAEDETRHAGLSWDIAHWAAPRLSSEEQARLHEARRHAVAVLRAEVAVPLDAQLTAEAGLPSPEVASALLDSLEQELWA
ncbi:ferritin-like domain-containing protein [Corallococcus aberystwythensis]|uniref:Ferritin-like domain-containing protein n=1 Tax=Corallococcus aberystwythensis TaxID=2316722 RepID=A0A3A8R0R2_9BACT|nr:ferritin-like domain-containing protein [Corallococcus aberystwythensis]RKH74443.1 ferritin-like domain-containing protein [Corallococcus aberystwythensis]